MTDTTTPAAVCTDIFGDNVAVTVDKAGIVTLHTWLADHDPDDGDSVYLNPGAAAVLADTLHAAVQQAVVHRLESATADDLRAIVAHCSLTKSSLELGDEAAGK